MPQSLKEIWENNPLVVMGTLMLVGLVAGINADDWVKNVNNDNQDERAEPSEDLRKEIEQVKQKNALLEAELRSRAPASGAPGGLAANYSDLQRTVAKLQDENRRLQRLCENQSPPAEAPKETDYSPDTPVKVARFDARLDLGDFCRLRYGMDFVRLQEDKLACEKSGEAQSAKLE